MPVQISMYIDEHTKQRFDKICESVGVTPSGAISTFISNAVRRNSIPFDEEMPLNKPKMTRAEMFGCARGQFNTPEDFDAPLDLVAVPKKKKPKRTRAEMFDSARGRFNIPDDFNEPLEDFKEYME